MEKQKEKFIKGAIENGIEEHRAEDLFKLIEPFSGYGFNKAHAASYGMVAYQTAYMKANFPVEFMCAYLTAESIDNEKISAAVNECKRIGITVLPPDINDSKVGFNIVHNRDSLNKKAIRFGFSAIKNVGKAAIDAILEARDKAQFSSFADFLSRVDSRRVNKKVLESLIKVGALSSFGSRAALLASMDAIRNKVSKPPSLKNQQGLFSQDEIKDIKSVDKLLSDVNEFTDEEIQSLERQLLGFSLSSRPIGELIKIFEHATTHKIFEISPKESLDELVRVAGVVTDIKIVVTRRTGAEMAFIRVEDGTGSLDLIVFPKIFLKTRNVWIDNKPILISGRVDTKDESPAIIVEAVETKETMNNINSDDNNKSDHLYVRIPKDTQKYQLTRLKNLFIENPGSKRVSLIFEGKEDKKVDLNIRVNWSEQTAAEISEILNNQKH